MFFSSRLQCTLSEPFVSLSTPDFCEQGYYHKPLTSPNWWQGKRTTLPCLMVIPDDISFKYSHIIFIHRAKILITHKYFKLRSSEKYEKMNPLTDKSVVASQSRHILQLRRCPKPVIRVCLLINSQRGNIRPLCQNPELQTDMDDRWAFWPSANRSKLHNKVKASD